MHEKIFAVMGATGHVGHGIALDLLKRGHIVRAIGRDQKKLQPLLDKGAEAWRMEFDDVNGLKDAFTDTYAVFCMLPSLLNSSMEFVDTVSLAICQALSDAKVARVVNLSSVGADLAEGTGPIKILHIQEKRLDALKSFSTLVHLRPNFFMENLNGVIPTVLNQGIIASSLDEDLPIPMVATRDIAWKAADFLDSSAPQPHLVFDFVGLKALAMRQVAELFGHVFDLPVAFKHLSYEEEREQMIKVGLKPAAADLLIEMNKGFNSGLIVPTQELTPSHHGRTSLEEYIQMIAHKKFVPMA